MLDADHNQISGLGHLRTTDRSEREGSYSSVSVKADDKCVVHGRRYSYGSLELRDDGREQTVPLRPRGPWDHSSSIKIPFDVSTIVAPPRPAAVNAVTAR